MNPFSPGNSGFDPSKLDPKLLMEMSQLVRQLPPDKLSQMQTLMHNMMAGFDVRQQMEEFEKSLPPGFREKIAALMVQSGGGAPSGAFSDDSGNQERTLKAVPDEGIESESPAEVTNLQEARLTVLRAVAEGRMRPEEAEKILFDL